MVVVVVATDAVVGSVTEASLRVATSVRLSECSRWRSARVAKMNSTDEATSKAAKTERRRGGRRI
jgi:hypothetical protein